MAKKSKAKPAGRRAETSLYAPVKAFLEGQGYTVKGEIGSCDVVARRRDETPVIVELKTGLTLELLLQGVQRLSLADTVYLAVPAPRGTSPVFDRRMHKLLRRVGLGLLLVHEAGARGRTVEVALDPLPYTPRINKRKAGRLLGEFARRAGDPNPGGTTRVKLVTAYRQEALRLASVLAAKGPQSPAALKVEAEAPKAGAILRDDHYGWFERVERGIYALTPAGLAALNSFVGRFAPPASLRPASAAE
ncbi:MAG: hypothetical protein FJX55_18355 [Alphaproteobacteria bacterium]|nr:hypothetical protein [Alphaproteobacteria bacterium]